ncbi:unnamed protein product [Eretmochelys imbricata]
MWGWALLPILLAICGTVGFWVVYAMSVANGSVNVTVMFPYISCGLEILNQDSPTPAAVMYDNVGPFGWAVLASLLISAEDL